MLRNSLFISIIILLALASCQEKKSEEAVEKKATASSEFYDLEDIQQSGEIIALTLYGPDTYYENHGQTGGIQFKILEEFCKAIGARARIEIADNEQDLINQLNSGEADLIAYNLPMKDSLKNELIWCGDSLQKRKASWAVRRNSPELAQETEKWFSTHEKEIHDIYTYRERLWKLLSRKAHMHHRAFMKNVAKGEISDYDALFRRYASQLGWDWKLLAAQSYQESGFDPQATSWAGARGLMQLMPGTAAQVGISASQIYEPDDNIRGSVKYLRLLDRQFQEVTSPSERILFMLAAYNCGPLHVKDAQALARKYGKNPHLWRGNVEEFILHLQERKYNQDPVVQNGYCRGSETYQYVRNILDRYQQYRSKIR